MSEKIDRSKVKKMVDMGIDDGEIAEELGCTEETIKHIRCKELGIKKKQKIDRDKVYEMLKEDKDDQEIADELGYAKNTIKGIRVEEFGMKKTRGDRRTNRLGLGLLRELFDNDFRVRRSELPDEFKSSNRAMVAYRKLRQGGLPVKMKREMTEGTNRGGGIKDVIFKIDLESDVLKAKQRRKHLLEKLHREVRDELKTKIETLQMLN